MSETAKFRIAVGRELRGGPAWMWVLTSGVPEEFDADAAEQNAAAWRSQGFDAAVVSGPPFTLPEGDLPPKDGRNGND